VKNRASKRPVSPKGERFEDFLKDQGIRDRVYGTAMKHVVAWQLEQTRKRKHVSKAKMATLMGTSRTQVDRVLDPQNVAVSLGMLDKAAQALGKKLQIELIDAKDSEAA
jgi:antitoxin HicB